MTKKLDLILPVYKEEKNIERVLDGIEKYVKTPHITNLVFFNSKDPTISVVKKIANKYSDLKLINNKKGRGLANQLKTGFENSYAPLIIIMMSDLSDDPKDIDKMVKKIDNGADFVCASRYMRNGKRKGGSRLKAFVSFTACQTLYIFTGLKTHDATNAFKCFKRDLLSKIKVESEVGYELPLELFVKAHTQGFKVAEIPTVWKERDKGYSKFKLFKYVPFYMRWYIYALKHRLGLFR